MKKIEFYLMVTFATIFFLIGCNDGGQMPVKVKNYNKISEVPDSVWLNLSKKKIYFGHQSVGYNIVDGIQDLIKENPSIKLNIKDTKDLKSTKNGVFAHSEIGKNTDYQSKISDFSDVIEKNANNIDIAFLKFCYVDINRQSDIDKMFEDYSKSMKKIQLVNPNVQVVHFSVPLTSTKLSLKQWIKKKLGRNVDLGYEDLIKRNIYNEKIVTKYNSNGVVFNIALLETTNQDGETTSFKIDDKTYYSLYPGYTEDGGHLNSVGRKKVAEQLLLLLASMI